MTGGGARGAIAGVNDRVLSVGAADRAELLALINQEMPFGRFKGTRLIDLPEPYVVWFKNEGFPSGRLGERLAILYEIKVNGLEVLLRELADDKAPDGK